MRYLLVQEPDFGDRYICDVVCMGLWVQLMPLERKRAKIIVGPHATDIRIAAERTGFEIIPFLGEDWVERALEQRPKILVLFARSRAGTAELVGAARDAGIASYWVKPIA